MQGFQRLPLGIVAMDTIDLTDQGLMGAAGTVTSAEGATYEVGAMKQTIIVFNQGPLHVLPTPMQ